MSRPSGSTLGRAAACPGSHALPGIPSSGKPAQVGNTIHAYLAVVAPSPASKGEALRILPEDLRARCAAIDVAAALDGLANVQTEVAFAFDVASESARVIGSDLGRNYGPLGVSELACTLDVMAVRADGVPVCLDWKTGQDVGAVAENWQMRLQTLCLWSLHKSDRVEARIAYVADDGSVRIDSHTFDAFELDDIASELARILEAVQTEQAAHEAGNAVQVAEGEHCHYCPAIASCPAKVALVRVMVPELATLGDAVAAMTPEQAGAAWVKVKAFAKLLDRAEAALKLRAELEALPLPSGKVLRLVPQQGRSYVDTAAAVALLRAKGATETELASVMRRARESLVAREVAQ